MRAFMIKGKKKAVIATRQDRKLSIEMATTSETGSNYYSLNSSKTVEFATHFGIKLGWTSRVLLINGWRLPEEAALQSEYESFSLYAIC